MAIQRMEGGDFVRVEDNGDRVRIAGAADATRQFRYWQSGLGIAGGDRYDARCASCWLGHAHSVAAHERARSTTRADRAA